MPAQKATEFVTLRQYLTWAVREGCTIQTGFASGLDGTMYMTVVTAASGRYAVMIDLDQDEALPVHAWEQYDRRLGLTSPFGKTQH